MATLKQIQEIRNSKATTTQPIKKITSIEELKKGFAKEQPRTFVSRVKENLATRKEQVAGTISRTIKNEQHPLETSLQLVGEGIGAIGDVPSAATMSIPGVEKGLTTAGQMAYENLPGLKEATEKYQTLSPRTRANIESLTNIASTLPVGGVLGLSGKAVSKVAPTVEKAVGKAAIKAGEKQASNLNNLFKTNTQTLRKYATFAEKKNINLGKEITDRGIKYDFDNERLNFHPDTVSNLESEIAIKSRLIDEVLLVYGTKINPSRLQNSVVSKIRSNPMFIQEGRVNEMVSQVVKKIKDYSSQSGAGYFTLPEIQSFKKGMYNLSKKYKATDVGASDAYSELASIFMRVIEDETPDVATRALNREIGRAEELLKFINKVDSSGGIVLKGGKLGKYFQETMGATAGAIIGTTMGGPIAGVMGGYAGKITTDFLRGLSQKSAILGPIDRMLIKRLETAGESIELRAFKEFLDGIKAGKKPSISPSVKEGFKRLFEAEVKSQPLRLPAPQEGKIYPQIAGKQTIPAIPAGKKVDYIGSGVATQERLSSIQVANTNKPANIKAININSKVNNLISKYNTKPQNSQHPTKGGIIKPVKTSPTVGQTVKQGLTNLKNDQRGMIKALNESNLTTKILDKLEGRTTVSKQFISDLTNLGDLKQVERDLIRDMLATEGDKVDVALFKQKVQQELLPLKLASPYSFGYSKTGTGQGMYEKVTLPENLRGSVEDYAEHIWESPIKTTAGETHFDEMNMKHYFGHTRIEDMAKSDTRRVIEVQSDLMQKNRLAEEFKLPEKVLNDVKAKFKNIKATDIEEYIKNCIKF